MGIGAMVGAGIFALLGQAGAIAGNAVWISFVIGGIIALLSGYSIGRLGATYPSSGGFVEYLVQSYGEGVFSGAISVMMYISALVSVSLIARVFGSYAYELLPANFPHIFVEIFSASIILFFMAINLRGASSTAKIENIVVVLKIVALSVFAIAGIVTLDTTKLSPALYPSIDKIFFALAITFFAYEGFRIITNAAEDMPNPAKTLPRAIITSILIVMLLYIAVSFAVFGNLSAQEVIKAKDYALAEAARPAFGAAGFIIMTLAALLSTSSAINASLYAVTNVTYRLATLGELPSIYGKKIAHSREGLIISSIVILLMALFFDLSSIAAIGAVSTLIIHMIVHIGHLRIIKKTKASLLLVILAIFANLSAIILSIVYLMGIKPTIVYWVVGFVALSFIIEIALRLFTGRVVVRRIYNHKNSLTDFSIK